MNAKHLTLLFGLVIGIIGLLWVLLSDWKIALGVLIMIWSNNIWLQEKDKDE